MWSMPRITVQLDMPFAWREARKTRFPDSAELALAAQSAGCDGLALSYRENNKPLLLRDFSLLRQLSTGPLFMAIPANQEAMRAVYEIKPAIALFVGGNDNPLLPMESYDLLRFKELLRSFLQNLKDAEISAAVLIEPDLEQIKTLHRLDVPIAVLNCTKLCQCSTESELNQELETFVEAVRYCRKLGLDVAVAGELTPRELRLLSPVEEIQNIIIGHWIWSRSLLIGIDGALKELRSILAEGPRR